ncbi:UNVERIFIED_ORG: hypothetical protein J2Y77_000524 [Pseudomonas lini]|uniref:Uncharacterized protein n=1 Tax=Pseudomonas viciae TaxID=2505979 RepID=A0A4P7PDW4_9PSED|nr:hypothetical protein [Pseudomonas viciae]QBZ88615.1 hypothetical protein EPZ47_07815 [Pseudomonas viciae]UZE87967.1 hypothetical protein LOY66_07735 [Pseudomonas viciae]WGO94945.1 hypothetical protein QCD61_07645 [Pseudomonas viciae]
MSAAMCIPPLPTAVGTCLGEEFVLRLAARQSGKSASFRAVEDASHSPQRQKTVTKNRPVFHLFAASSHRLKICLELLLTPKSRQNPQIQRLSL